jgi:hypothetical protein
VQLANRKEAADWESALNNKNDTVAGKANNRRVEFIKQ